MTKLLAVQILRGVAALAIAVLHAQHDASALHVAGGEAWTPAFRLPWPAGVDVFFVISGFIMVHASQGLFGREGARGAFLARRIARIVPLYWAVTTFYLALAVVLPGLLNSEILEPWPVLASYLFIPVERPDGTAQPLYSLGWTLNYEMFFYGLFALAIAWPSRRAVPILAATLVGLVGIGLAFRLPQPFAFWTSPILLEFVFGLGLGYLSAQGLTLARPWRALLAMVAMTLLALDLTSPDGFVVLPRPLAWGVPAALLVAAAALGRQKLRPASAATRFGVALGDASYALYLLHPFAIRGIRALAEATGLAPLLGPWGFMILSLAGAVALALAAHRLLERPATEWMRVRLGALRRT